MSHKGGVSLIDGVSLMMGLIIDLLDHRWGRKGMLKDGVLIQGLVTLNDEASLNHGTHLKDDVSLKLSMVGCLS